MSALGVGVRVLHPRLFKDGARVTDVTHAPRGVRRGSAKVDDGALVSGDAGADEKPVVDDAQPTTTIMIRLHNGKRMKATLNLSHTVRHVQARGAAQAAARLFLACE